MQVCVQYTVYDWYTCSTVMSFAISDRFSFISCWYLNIIWGLIIWSIGEFGIKSRPLHLLPGKGGCLRPGGKGWFCRLNRSFHFLERKANWSSQGYQQCKGDLRVRQDLLCRLGNLGDQLVGGWIEHINPPGQETQLSIKKIYSRLLTLPSSPYTMGSGDLN